MRPPYSQHERPAKKRPLDPILTELEGYTGLGMKREALRLIRRILRQPKVTAVQFEEAVGTLFTTENRLKRWRKHVEAGYARLSARGQRRARFWMLSFFHSAHDYTSASRFIPERFRSPYGMIELAFAWDIWGALENEQALARHFDQMADWAERAEDPFMRGNLFASLGDYCLHRAWWRRAVECYKEIPVESANAHQAVIVGVLHAAGDLALLAHVEFVLSDEFEELGVAQAVVRVERARAY